MPETSQNRPTAVAWDPRSPATLLLPSVSASSTTSSSGNNNNDGFQMNSFVSHDGIGCNTHETSALMELLDARDIYLEDSSHSRATDGNTALRALSKAYRKALSACVEGWEESLDGGKKTPVMEENLELLKLAYAVTHLSETFLLTPSNDVMMDYYQSTSNLPGAVTADTIRYLRLHHMGDASAFVKDEEYEELNNSYQPDQLDGGALYWKLVESYLVRGCLEDAWALLSRHSIYRRCVDDAYQSADSYQAAKLQEDREGFEALRAVLLSAPLPGGRTDEFDSAFDGEQDSENAIEMEYLEGIPPSAYCLWESGDTARNSGDFPSMFQPHAASQMYNMWQQAVSGMPAVNQLKRRIPQLQRIIAVMTGNFHHMEFDCWADELCAELLYKKPNLRLSDIHVRAQIIMDNHGETAKGSFEEVVLSVMQGNSGRVIEVMHELGGGSGAALPAVMVSCDCALSILWKRTTLTMICSLFLQTCLLCQLLHDAQMILDPSENYSVKSELLLNAAFALRSSLATEGQHDLGARLAVRLLVPYVKTGDDVEIAAAIVNTLEHHAPETDAEANTILALCLKLVERKSVRVLDGCISIVLARYRHFLSDQRPGGAVHWLLKGIELESLVLCDGPQRTGAWQETLSTGVCYRLLVAYFQELSQSLLKCLLGDEEGASLQFASAKEMVAAAQEEAEIASFIPAVKVLEHFVGMAEAIAARKDEALVARSIVACLEERANDEEGGVVSSLARPSMHWDLLRLAKGILDRNAQRDRLHERQSYSAPFDVRGMQVLMERFTLMIASREIEKSKPISEAETSKMRLALGDGLMRAFVAENASKKAALRTGRKVSIAGIHSSDLGKYSREKQEMVVEKMLDF
jgi:hypothetical protein